MKLKCESMLDDIKQRAIKQLQYAIPILFNAGKDVWFSFRNPATCKGESEKVVGCYSDVFKIGIYDDEQMVLFFNFKSHRFEPVEQMEDVASLAKCADFLTYQANELKQSK